MCRLATVQKQAIRAPDRAFRSRPIAFNQLENGQDPETIVVKTETQVCLGIHTGVLIFGKVGVIATALAGESDYF